MDITNFKKMKLLTNEQQKSYQNVNIGYICKEQFEDKHGKDKNYCKIRDHGRYIGDYRGAAHIINNLEYRVLKKFL